MIPAGVSGPLSQLRQLAWLKCRHARTELAWWGYAAGMDIVEDRDWFERMYQLYVVLILGVCMFMGWAAVLDATGGVFAALGPDAAMTCAGAVTMLLPFALFALAAVGALRQSAFKFTVPDAAFVASGAFDTWAIAVANALSRAAATAVPSGLFAFLVVSGAVEAAPVLAGLSGRDGVLLAIAAGLASAAAAELGQGIGYIRLRLGMRSFARRAAFSAVALVLVACVLACGLMLIGACAPALLPAVASAVSLPFTCAIAFFSLVFAAVVVCLGFARNLDLVAAIEESGAYAALYGARRLALGAPDAYRELRRRYRISHRRLRPTVPMASGAFAPVARALQTHLRQFDGLPRLVFVGAVLCPVSALMLTVEIPPFLLFSFVFLLFSSITAIRELSLAFRADQGIRLVRDALPFSALQLAMLDGLPAFVFVLALSLSASGALSAFVPGLFSPDGLILAVLFPLFFALAAPLDGVESSRSGRRLSCGTATLVVAIASACLSLWLPDALAPFLACSILYLLCTLARSA